MAQEFTAIFEQDEGWWIGRTEELRGAFGQGRTLDECRESLRQGVDLLLETLREQADAEITAEGRSVIREQLAVG